MILSDFQECPEKVCDRLCLYYPKYMFWQKISCILPPREQKQHPCEHKKHPLRYIGDFSGNGQNDLQKIFRLKYNVAYYRTNWLRKLPRYCIYDK